MAKIGLYVFGTSILWGQGHNKEKKMHTRIATWLKRSTGKSVSVRHAAHSGAVLKGPAGPGPKPLHGEVPTAYPSLAKQIRRAPLARENRVCVLIEAGINDVGVFNIINPLYSKQKLKKQTRQACYTDLLDVLVQAGRKYPIADIYVIGYYQILADKIGKHASKLEELLCALRVCDAQDLEGDFVSRAVENTKLFWEESTKQIRKAVRDANDAVRANLVFVDSGYLPSEGLFGPRSLLYNIGNRDPQADNRFVPCARAIAKGRSAVHCFFASVGHPNSRGVTRYAGAIKAAIKAAT